MRLINVKAFIERERKMCLGWPVTRRTKVLEFCDDETTNYAILSHRWTDQEIDHDEMVELAKMEVEERDEIRQRDGYRKILDSCKQAERDKYEWLWVDTCCIDKRSSAELSEAINSMYRWYEHSKVCYAYLHDVPGISFPTKCDNEKHPVSNGWPEWFSRGWTLQEMIAPSNVQFFNKDWQHIGNKRSLAHILSCITRVPPHILTGGLSSNRPCVAQIMSWAADRTTTRIEDRAYSLLGLLDVNMPMLYGEGKKAFHRLQLEIIRMSNDHSIFAWGFDEETRRDRDIRWDRGTRRSGSILADTPSFFRECNQMELIDHNEFIRYVKKYNPEEDINEDRFTTFPITNRGIHIWLLFRPLDGSESVFEAWLPCRSQPSCRSQPAFAPVRITLALWNSDYYRFFTPAYPIRQTLKFHQVYLRYQDTPHCITFEIDDSAITENGFACCGVYPSNLIEPTLKLTSNDPLCVKVYSDSQSHCRFAVGFGQCFGQDWIHFVYEGPTSGYPWESYSRFEYDKLLVKSPEHARSMAEVRSRGGRYGRVWVKHNYLPGSNLTVRVSCVMWEGSTKCGVRIDAVQYPYNVPDNWKGFDVGGTNGPNRDIRGLMIPHRLRNEFQSSYVLLVEGVTMEWTLAPKGIKRQLGDYGCLTESEDFHCEGNIFTDLRTLPSEMVASSRHRIDRMDGYNTNSDYVEAHKTRFLGVPVTLYKPHASSLPINCDVNALLVSLSTRLTNRYIVTSVIQCNNVPPSQSSTLSNRPVKSYGSSKVDPTTPLCIFAKPFMWHQDEDIGSTSVDQSGDELRTETRDEGRHMRVEDANDEVDSVVAKRGFFGRRLFRD
ncbi:heterokaryon incompatibility protein-domain-containing protein [Scleroderma yunnanense]